LLTLVVPPQTKQDFFLTNYKPLHGFLGKKWGIHVVVILVQ
jgi:hypothetical protein